MSRKHGHWGFAEEAKAWATHAQRRDEGEELRQLGREHGGHIVDHLDGTSRNPAAE